MGRSKAMGNVEFGVGNGTPRTTEQQKFRTSERRKHLHYQDGNAERGNRNGELNNKNNRKQNSRTSESRIQKEEQQNSRTTERQKTETRNEKPETVPMVRTAEDLKFRKKPEVAKIKKVRKLRRTEKPGTRKFAVLSLNFEP